MPSEPMMTGALPAPSQEPAHHNNRELRPTPSPSRERSVHYSQDRRNDGRSAAVEPSIHVTPPSQPGHNSSDRDRTRTDQNNRHLAPPSEYSSNRPNSHSKPSSELNNRQPIRPTNEDHRGPSRGPASTNRNPSQPIPNFSRPNPSQQQTYGVSEPPPRITSLRPPDDPPSGGRRMTPAEADALCQKLTSQIWDENMGKLYDTAVEADKRGNIDDKLYYQLLDFFYCFLPIVTKSPPSDPIVVRATDLENHRRILNMFREGQISEWRPGPNGEHRWFSRPSDGTFKSRMQEGIRGFRGVMMGKKGRAEKVAVR